MDGANVEIFEEVGEDNIVIFGMSAEEVAALTASGSYRPWDVYNMDTDIQQVLTKLINGSLSSDPERFREIYEALLNGYNGQRPDEYYVLEDFAAYAKAQDEIGRLYMDKDKWAKIAITNVAKAGKFSSDRTILQYANEIWKLEKLEVK